MLKTAELYARFKRMNFKACKLHVSNDNYNNSKRSGRTEAL